MNEQTPIPMYLTCPKCCERHVDTGDFATKAHHTHSCQKCGLTWRPAIVPTVGVLFLPGFKSPPAITVSLIGSLEPGTPVSENAARELLRRGYTLKDTKPPSFKWRMRGDVLYLKGPSETHYHASSNKDTSALLASYEWVIFSAPRQPRT